MENSRRKFLTTASLSSLGLVAAASSVGSLIPEKLKGVSSAASALCTWIRAIESYARVYRIVQPKKERYQKALFELNEKQNLLQQSKNELLNIQKKIENLQ